MKSTRGEALRLPVARRLQLGWQAYRWPLLTALGMVSLVLGYRGFRQWAGLHHEPHTVSDDMYLAIQLITLQSGYMSDPVPFELDVARFTTPLIFAYAAAITVWEIFQEQRQLLRLRFLVDHTVVAGLGRKGLQLVTDLRRQGQSVVILDRDENNPNLRECRELGAIVLVGTPTDYWLLQRARVYRARYLCCTCGDDGTNVEIAVKARDIVADVIERGRWDLVGLFGRFLRPLRWLGDGPHDEGLRTLVHLINAPLRKRLEREQAAGAAPGARPMQFFNVYQEGARLLLTDHPPVVEAGVPRGLARDVIVVGFGRMGERVALQLVRSGDFGDGRPLHLTVVDREAGLKERAFRRTYPAVGQLASLSFHEVDTHDVAHLATALEPYADGSRSACMVYICLDTDAAGLECAMLLEQLLRARRPPIIVRMEQDRGLATLLESGTGPGIFPFGVINRVCRSDALLRYTRDRLAREIHGGGPGTLAMGGQALELPMPDTPWEDLPESVKNTSRQQADHVNVKLRAIGCRPVETHGAAPFALAGEDVDKLARMEHARWRAEHLLAGWTRAETLDPTARTSPYLVDWESLPERIQQCHRQSAEHIPHHLRALGLSIERHP